VVTLQKANAMMAIAQPKARLNVGNAWSM
jgi:hypothetical protein